METTRDVLLGPAKPLGDAVGPLQTFALPVRWNQGPESRWGEPVRRVT